MKTPLNLNDQLLAEDLPVIDADPGRGGVRRRAVGLAGRQLLRRPACPRAQDDQVGRQRLKVKPIVPWELANRDVEEAVACHLSEATAQAALGFIDALEQACTHIGRHAATGSPRNAHDLNLPGLRAWPLKRYPHLVFCVERPGRVDVWRVLHRRTAFLRATRDGPVQILDAGATHRVEPGGRRVAGHHPPTAADFVAQPRGQCRTT